MISPAGPSDEAMREAVGALAAVAAGSSRPSAGVVAGGVTGLAAGLCEAVARAGLTVWPGARGAAVQAAELRRRAEEATAENAVAYGAARTSLGTPAAAGETGRDALLRAVLLRAAEAPLRTALHAADCVTLAADIAREAPPDLRADAVAAAELASAATRAAAGLVEINLALLASDPRRAQARAAVAAAEADVARARDIAGLAG